jgi:hypothetical protein
MVFNFLAKGADLQFRNFSELVSGTTRTERNNLFGSAVVYKPEYDVFETFEKVKLLIAETQEHLRNLENLANLMEADIKDAEQKKAIIERFKTMTLAELQEMEGLLN